MMIGILMVVKGFNMIREVITEPEKVEQIEEFS